ncbi:hypothetical protein FT663_03886 [Candidozyma haemuli var. vulneris]|uniref:Major facilitator superfamily (MFS) profile domain-containing protein n=1 Tax=Candidozyma haemuli TaxID=45357 RepID=A0A2V1ANJ1_9ASCO|nr:hypothetical protein CXQ85_001580 [[Candida] haemuloni]KAF3987567.1 hypothetical protein FT662_03938 [[Candida] haemuloni var. vulneris]KAF3988847.1 hypothetical protein FT663_03886 [[Candida] haemuloni var. vulneris]PVH19274.1 hypothetical protein CXQ85_001580 [[Candida] haemuloni]
MSHPLYQAHRVTPALAWATGVNCFSTIQFGFNLAATNAPAKVIACKKHLESPGGYADSFWGHMGTDQCIPMSFNDIALMSTMFTLGGFLSSVVAGSPLVSSVVGRKRIQIICAVLFFCGSTFLCIANTRWAFLAGRALTGLASGVSIVVAPIMVNELAPFNHRGLMGSLLQFGVAFGILAAQLTALSWSNDHQWRWIFAFGAGLALTQLVLLFTITESPKWMITHRGNVSKATRTLHTLRSEARSVNHEIQHWREITNNSKPPVTEESPLLDSEDDLPSTFTTLSPSKSRRGSIDPSSVSMYEYVTTSQYKKEVIAVGLIMTAQQLCGMNAINFYGVSILESVMPYGFNVLYITSSIALCNVVAMLAVSPFIDKVGRKPLLITSLAIMGVSSCFISIGMLTQHGVVASIACFTFVIGFSLGLGQIPMLMVSELSSHQTIGVAQSFGTMLNWGANVAVAYGFPQLQLLLDKHDFFVFFGICFVYIFLIYCFVPETQGRLNYDDIWTSL